MWTKAVSERLKRVQDTVGDVGSIRKAVKIFLLSGASTPLLSLSDKLGETLITEL